MTTDLLGRALERADALRATYRAAGVWSPHPLDVVQIAARRHPSKTAVVDRRYTLTYAELDRRVDRASKVLRAAGVTAQTPLLLVVGNDIESVVSVHAAIRADAVVLLVSRSAGPNEVGDIARRTGTRLGVAPNWAQAAGCHLDAGFHWIDLLARVDAPRSTPQRPADDPSFVLFTSGTTSRPKGVIHSLSTLAKASFNYIDAAGLGPHDRLFLISPLASVTGVVQAVFVAPMLTAPVILEDRWDPAATYELLVSTGSTWYGGPDRLLDRLLDHAAADGREIPVRAVYLGGTMLDRRVVQRIEDDFGIIVMRAYGSSEAPVSTSGRRSEARELRHADDGRPLTDVEVKIGSTSQPTECCIRGPHVFLGYTDAHDDDSAFNGDWYCTGDAGELTDGRLRIVGRLRDIVIRNGLKVAIVEVEDAIARIPGVRECAAYSVPDATTGERLAAAVVMESGAGLSLSAVAESLIAAGLPKYKLPEELVFWDQPLPVNANGKVDRNTLDARSQGRPREIAARLSRTG
ncbi:long-chain-fatty-acid--CoA ligase [Mycobacterium sp. MFM001]|uniref:class I adenylate-forming enzyme family protein n=1 Tax=Mycobacterium sp. MFM001 TaxID=2049453 RepID=UPI000DA4DA39|nr:class I adenylate-forming enzyme family protein [Mycobacterium sp. MFM001]GBE64477.1 long-chain-fatty-acid--CoA ligase [Mycobacterium sp. MFM001]